MPKPEKGQFGGALSDLKLSIDKHGVMTSEAVKAPESSLGTDARRLGGVYQYVEGQD